MIVYNPSLSLHSRIKNEWEMGSLSNGVYEITFVSSSASVPSVDPRIKLPYHISVMIIDFWINSVRFIC